MTQGISCYESVHHGQSCIVVTTPTAEYRYQHEAGGFSSLRDSSGTEWIGFKSGEAKAPQGAASIFRGIPNLVFPDNVGHPGHRGCTSSVQSLEEAKVVISTESKDRNWAWNWEITAERAALDVTRVPADRSYWFLYEGTIAGTFSPRGCFWGTDTAGRRTDTPLLNGPDRRDPIHEPYRWVYFGRDSYDRVLFAINTTSRGDTSLYSYMSADGQGLDGADGMVVFGFGRGPGTQPLLKGLHSFVIGFLETTDHARIAERLIRYRSD